MMTVLLATDDVMLLVAGGFWGRQFNHLAISHAAWQQTGAFWNL